MNHSRIMRRIVSQSYFFNKFEEEIDLKTIWFVNLILRKVRRNDENSTKEFV